MRGKGEGSIYRRADGYWVGQVELRRGPNGKRRRARVVRKYRAQVVEALDELRQQVRNDVIPDRTRTVTTFLDFWLTDVIREQVSEGSHAEYVKRIRRIVPTIGHVKLGRLTVPHVQALAADLGRIYSPKTARTTLETLRAALRWAVAAQMIARNPAEHVILARALVAKVDDTLTAEEAKAILRAAEGDDLETLWWLALKYGMRLGELLDLRWGDVDLDGGELHIRKAKTAAGVRSLPLVDDAEQLLRAQHERTGHRRSYVFATPTGGRRKPQHTRTEWNRVLAAAAVPHRCRNCGSDRKCSTSIRRFHASRHTAATLLLEAGVALEVVSAILGHSSIGITANIYAKVRNDLKRRGLQALDDD